MEVQGAIDRHASREGAHHDKYTDSEAADQVTFENLDGNGDVGAGSTQVAQGDHTHTLTEEGTGTDVTIGATNIPRAATAATEATESASVACTDDDRLCGGATGISNNNNADWDFKIDGVIISTVTNSGREVFAGSRAVASGTRSVQLRVYGLGNDEYFIGVGGVSIGN